MGRKDNGLHSCPQLGRGAPLLGQNTGPPAVSLKSAHVQSSAAVLAWGAWTQLPKGLAKLCGIFNFHTKSWTESESEGKENLMEQFGPQHSIVMLRSLQGWSRGGAGQGSIGGRHLSRLFWGLDSAVVSQATAGLTVCAAASS